MSEDMLINITVVIVNSDGETETGSRAFASNFADIGYAANYESEMTAEAIDEAEQRFADSFGTSGPQRTFILRTTLARPSRKPSHVISANIGEDDNGEPKLVTAEIS